jgi:hypothetical protein
MAGAPGAAGVAGAPGAKGDKGDPGSPGAAGNGFTESDLYVVSSVGFNLPGGGKATAAAYCNDNNDVAISGGCSTQNAGGPNFQDRPFLYATGLINVGDPNSKSGWSCSAESDDSAGIVFASVVCLTVP